MSETVSATQMLEQQKKDKEAITEKQVANNEAINTVIAKLKKLADDDKLHNKQAELKAAQASPAEKATAEMKRILLEEKAARKSSS